MNYQQRISLSLIIPLAAVASFAVSCKPSSDNAKAQPASTVNQQIDKAQSAASEVTKDLKAYTYAEKKEFVATMERQLTDLNRGLDELETSIAKAGPAIKAEATPKLAALRTKADLLTKQLGNAKDATSSTWETVKATTSNAYDELSTNFNQARQWVSEIIAP